jgi:hypothetical protein
MRSRLEGQDAVPIGRLPVATPVRHPAVTEAARDVVCTVVSCWLHEGLARGRGLVPAGQREQLAVAACVWVCQDYPHLSWPSQY